MSEQKWVRTSLGYLSERLKQLGRKISHTTVGRLLKKAVTVCRSMPNIPSAMEQFKYIERQ